MTYWLAIGPSDNWAFCFKNNGVWGFTEVNRKTWERIHDGDIVLCYATSPVKGVIGYCTVRSIGEATSSFFPQEVQHKNVMWPLRVRLAPVKLLSQPRWTSSRATLERGTFTFQRALQELSEATAKAAIRVVDKT